MSLMDYFLLGRYVPLYQMAVLLCCLRFWFVTICITVRHCPSLRIFLSLIYCLSLYSCYRSMTSSAICFFREEISTAINQALLFHSFFAYLFIFNLALKGFALSCLLCFHIEANQKIMITPHAMNISI